MVTVTILPPSPCGERGPQETAVIAIKTSHNETFFMPLFVQCKINNLWYPRVKRFRDETVQHDVINRVPEPGFPGRQEIGSDRHP
jgi:hypothetical protein